MNSWLIIVLLLILLIIVTGMVILVFWDIKKMSHQLTHIIENFGTNELVRSNTQSKILSRFVANINQLIQVFKQDQQSMLKREKEIKQEITNLSHDIRTPLTSIQGFTELLTDPALSDEDKQEYIRIIQQKIDHLIMVTDSFYELSQIDSADTPLAMEKQWLDQIIVETMLLFYEDFEKRKLEVHVEEGNYPAIYADKKATSRIVTNIIQNALRYAKSYVKIQLLEEGNYLTFRAINDVEKLDRNDVQRIFDRTFRLDPSRTSGQLGLGLHIVQQLVEKQGGNVTADVENNEFILEVNFQTWDRVKEE